MDANVPLGVEEEAEVPAIVRMSARRRRRCRCPDLVLSTRSFCEFNIYEVALQEYYFELSDLESLLIWRYKNEGRKKGTLASNAI